MKKSLIHNLFYSFIALIVLLLMYILSPGGHYYPKGIFLASTQGKYPVSQEAKVFKNIPDGYHKIGIVNMTLYSRNSLLNQQNAKSVVYAALKNIAKQGATGLVIRQLYFLPQAKYGRLSAGYHLLGEAIRGDNT